NARTARDDPVPAALVSCVDGETTTATRAAHLARGAHRCRPPLSSPVSLGSGAVLVALAADMRRRVRLARQTVLGEERAIDAETALLGMRAPATQLLACVARS